jgi:hypothetical protein
MVRFEVLDQLRGLHCPKASQGVMRDLVGFQDTFEYLDSLVIGRKYDSMITFWEFLYDLGHGLDLPAKPEIEIGLDG